MNKQTAFLDWCYTIVMANIILTMDNELQIYILKHRICIFGNYYAHRHQQYYSGQLYQNRTKCEQTAAKKDFSYL